MKNIEYKYCDVCDNITKKSKFTGNDFVVYSICCECNTFDVLPKNNSSKKDVDKHFTMIWNSVKHMRNKNNFRLAG